MNECASRAADALRSHGLPTALLSSPHNVCYVTGYEVPIEAGPSPFASGPAIAVLDGRGHVTLVVPDTEELAAHARGYADLIVSYPAFGYRERYDQAANKWEALRRVLRETGVTAGPCGVEWTSLPASLERAIREEYDALDLRDAVPALREARAVKTMDEIARLRRAVDLTAIGQRAARDLVRPGVTEIGLFAGVRGAMEQAAGRRLPVTGDLVSGTDRTANMGGWPIGRVIEPGDLVLVDLAPRFNGYWGDSCNTLYLGEPTAEHRRMLQATTEALARGIAASRPGVPAAVIDAACRHHVEGFGYAYPHHTGHALGTTVHEDPRLVPYEQMLLQAGMVLALEPAAYVPGVGGVRSEHVIVVTDTGAEVLSSFAHQF